ncbi:hypothetical protein AB0M36_34265 [Actinoplanes sp. NPDC051346]|uniref:hypothetical protein n=1 Tax=Actinoplanes sp. NPDC051346 TaxID=3155048 RepID=UPI003435F52D
MLEGVLKSDIDAADVVSWSWNGTEVQVGAWAERTTKADRLRICDAVVNRVRGTAEATQVIVTAHSGRPSTDPVSWQSPGPRCHADEPEG